MRLTINLATRGRPERVLETVQRTIPHLVEPHTCFVISIDDDDEATQVIRESLMLDRRIVIDSRQREDALGAKWNRALDYPSGVYLPMADYTPHQTPGFDARILEAAALFPDNIGVVYTHMANWSFPSGQAATHGLVKKLGFMYP